MSAQSPSIPLIDAVEKDNLAAVERLLKEGGEVDAKDASGRTALMAATQKNNFAIAQRLIEAGADVNARDATMLTPFLCAAANGFNAILKLAITAGADLNSVNRFGGTPLLPASEKGFLRTVRVCLAAGISVNHVNDLGWSALLEAVILGDGGRLYADVIEALVEAGADQHLCDRDGKSSLEHAKELGQRRVLEIFRGRRIAARLGAEAIRRAKDLEKSERYEEAIAIIEAALVAHPQDVDLLYYKGYYLYELGQGREAIRAFEAALSLSPNENEFRFYIAYAYRMTRQPEAALATFDEGIAQEQESPFLRYHKSNYLRELGRHEAAVAVMDELLARQPRRYDFSFHKANSLRSLGRHQEAITAIEHAIAADPGNSLYRLHKAQSLRLLGREAEAEAELARNTCFDLSGANLAIIAAPGEFAVRQVRRALEGGLHVLLFGDNGGVEDEAGLKTLAHEKGLQMLGPNCGIAYVGGVGPYIANAVRAGNIGIVDASGAGSQEVAARVHDFGGGISQIVNTGGHDLNEKVGGVRTIDGLQALARDPATEVIVLVSKPWAKSLQDKVLAAAVACSKPVVACLFGGSEEAVAKAGLHFGKTTKEAALKAVILGGKKEEEINKHALNLPLIAEIKAKLKPEQRYIRALLCGGALCEEMMLIARETFDNVYSNIAKGQAHTPKDLDTSVEHSFIDFGDDDFTRGRPHPIVDPAQRSARLLQEARDPSVGVIVLDFILGYGAHADPVGVMVPAIVKAKKIAADEGRHLEILGYVLGTELDSQSLADQTAKLEAVGVTIASSCTNAGLLARGFVSSN